MEPQENLALYFDWADPMQADIDAAQFSILITSLSLHPPRSTANKPIFRLWQALEKAAARGVQVDFIMARQAKSHPATACNNSAAERLHAMGCRPNFAQADRLLHAKTAVIDARTVWVGSGNWTAAATAHNREAYMRADSVEFAQRMRKHWHDLGYLGA